MEGEDIKPGNYDIRGIDSEIINEEWGPTLYLPGEVLTIDNSDNPDLWGNLEVQMEE